MKSLTRLWHSWRWWTFLLAMTLAFATLGYKIGPPPDREPTAQYTASTTLVLTDPFDRELSATRMELEMTRGAVPTLSAVELGFSDTLEFLAVLDIEPDDSLGTLEITSLGETSREAVSQVETISNRYLAFKLSGVIADREIAIQGVQIDKAAVEGQLRNIDILIARQQATGINVANDGTVTTTGGGQPSSVSVARRQALVGTYSELLRLEAALDRAPTSPVIVAGDTTVVESFIGGLSTPLTPAIMGIIGAILGLALGLGTIALAYRVHDRIDSRDEAEAAYGATVLADISRIPRRVRKKSDIVTFDLPDAPTSASYRHLRTMVAAISRETKSADNPSTVYLVTSAHSTEGKSTTVANLAAAFSDSGSDVIVISGDLRRPYIHKLLGVDASHRGILEAPSDITAEELEAQLARTTLPRVRLLPHGAPVNNPGELLASRRPVIDRCRELAEVVIIDAPPTLVGNDVAELLPAVDHVIVTARASVTKTAQARAARRLLRSLGAHVIGVALVESNDKSRRRYRYGSRTKTTRSARITSLWKSEVSGHDTYPDPESTESDFTIAARERVSRMRTAPIDVDDTIASVVSKRESANGESDHESADLDKSTAGSATATATGAKTRSERSADRNRHMRADAVESSASSNGSPKHQEDSTDEVDAEIAELLASQSDAAWTRQRTK